MATFGITATDGTEENFGENYKMVSKFTLTENGSVEKLSFYMRGSGGGGSPLRGIIYTDSGGNPDVRKAIGSEIITPDGAGLAWEESTITPAVSLAAGDYWIGMIHGAGGTCIYTWHAVAGNRKYKAEAYSATPADPFGSVDGTDTHELAIYATYTPLGNPTYTILNGSDEQLLNVNAGGTDIDAATYKDGVQLSESELATLLSASFGKNNVAVLPDLTGVADARQIKKTTFSAETESA